MRSMFLPMMQSYQRSIRILTDILSIQSFPVRQLILLNKDVFKELGLDAEKFNSYEDLLGPKLKGHIAMGDPTNSSSAWAELTNMLLVRVKSLMMMPLGIG